MGQPDYGNETLSVMAETRCAEGEQEAAFTDLTTRLREALKPFVKEMRKG